MKICVYAFLIFMLLSGCSSDDFEKVFVIDAGDNALVNTPVYVDIENGEFNENTSFCLHSDHEVVPGQLEILDDSRQRIWWIVNLESGQSAEYGLSLNDECHSGTFEWSEAGKNSSRLSFNGQGVLQYEHPDFDTSRHMNTHKPFHHVFKPTGDEFITKGDSAGLYPHHRGIFFGYRNITVGDKEVNVWAGRNGFSEHAEVIEQYAGPVMGGHEVKIHWKDGDGENFIEERREVRAFRQPEGQSLIDFQSTLRTLGGPVMLDGDRQHAGVHFRAAEIVAERRDETRYIRPANLSHVAATDEIKGEDIYDLPWNAINYVVDESGNKITVAYMSHPENPDDAEMSERLYGRFGEFFPYEVTENDPLNIKYRFWVKEGEAPSVDSLNIKYQSYENPPNVEIRNE